MDLSREDYLKRALLDTQERVRDYMNYSKQVGDEELQSFFKDFAETEGKHAEMLQGFISEIY